MLVQAEAPNLMGNGIAGTSAGLLRSVSAKIMGYQNYHPLSCNAV